MSDPGAASDHELHSFLLLGGGGLCAAALFSLGMVLRRHRARLRGRSVRPPLGWAYVFVHYVGWWVFAVLLIIALLRVDTPRPYETGLTALFVALTIITGVLLRTERRAERT